MSGMFYWLPCCCDTTFTLDFYQFCFCGCWLWVYLMFQHVSYIFCKVHICRVSRSFHYSNFVVPWPLRRCLSRLAWSTNRPMKLLKANHSQTSLICHSSTFKQIIWFMVPSTMCTAICWSNEPILPTKPWPWHKIWLLSSNVESETSNQTFQRIVCTR